MCCGKTSSRARGTRSGKITRTRKQPLPTKQDNEQQHSKDRERLQPFSERQSPDQTRTVGPSSVQR